MGISRLAWMHDTTKEPKPISGKGFYYGIFGENLEPAQKVLRSSQQESRIADLSSVKRSGGNRGPFFETFETEVQREP